jgi:hypothetical protein
MEQESPPSDGSYTLAVQKDQFEPGTPVDFRFSVLGPDGEAVSDYRLLHERELHLIVVRQDLATFSHLHPMRDAGGTWHIDLTLPLPGPYRAFADMHPADGPELTLAVDLTAPGEWVEEQLPPPSGRERAGDYDVNVTGQLVAGVHSEIAFRISRNGQGVDLQPYLGALGHLVALRAADLAYLHVHPVEDSTSEAVRFGVEVPSTGAYRLFLQFQHEDRVHTAPFTVHASEPPADHPMPEPGHPSHH